MNIKQHKVRMMIRNIYLKFEECLSRNNEVLVYNIYCKLLVQKGGNYRYIHVVVQVINFT